jgi:DNA-binding NtrC family response regulator
LAKILIADDEPDIRDALKRICARDGHEILLAPNGREAVDLARAERPQLVLLDNRMPGMSGLDALARIRQFDKEVVAILYTAHDEPSDVHRAVLELGAYGYLLKSQGGDVVRTTIVQALRSRGFDARRKTEGGAKLPGGQDFAGMVGRSESMKRIFDLIKRIGHSDVTVLIQGESGTGKELVARAIHDSSLRAAGPYVTVDCGTLPDTLMESEIFGYEAGAFTDARRSKPGKIELADGGTLFLDEIGNLPLTAQAKLLRAIEDKRISRLGDNVVREVDVRIVTATNVDLEQASRDRTFREDLYYRLNVFKLWLPPLRERAEDIPRMVEHFVRVFAAQQGREAPRLTEESMQALVSRHWPGNVRELRNVLERAVLLSEDALTPELLAPEIAPSSRPAPPASAPPPAAAAPAGAPPPPAPEPGPRLPALPSVDLEGLPLKEAKRLAAERVERAYIVAALEKTRWNKAKAARLLGLNYKTLREKIQEHGLEDEPA